MNGNATSVNIQPEVDGNLPTSGNLKPKPMQAVFAFHIKLIQDGSSMELVTEFDGHTGLNSLTTSLNNIAKCEAPCLVRCLY